MGAAPPSTTRIPPASRALLASGRILRVMSTLKVRDFIEAQRRSSVLTIGLAMISP